MASHRCTVCGTTGPWGPSWSWYGSIKDADTYGAESVPKFCTDTCRDKWADENAAALVADGAGPRRR